MTRKFQKLRFGKNIKLCNFSRKANKWDQRKQSKTKLSPKKNELRQGRKVATPSFQQNTLSYVLFTTKTELKENKINKFCKKIRLITNSSATENAFIST